MVKLCLQRPVFTWVMNLLLILLGLIAAQNLSVREYPQIDKPFITVQISYPGASAEVMESRITRPVEESLAGIAGVQVMNSITRSENTQVTLEFKLSVDPDVAANAVRDKISRVRALLPIEATEPVIAKEEADAQPILYLAFSSTVHSAMSITDIADRYVKDALQTIDGVSNITIFGARTPSMRIWLDPTRLAQYQLSVQEVENAIRTQNNEIPSGRIESYDREFTLLFEGDLNTPDAFNKIVVKKNGTQVIRLSDVAEVKLAPLDTHVITRFDGKPAVAIGVIREATANPLTIAASVRQMVNKLNTQLPEGLSLTMAYDSTVFISESIHGVLKTLVEAVVLVILVIYAILKSWRAVLIPTIAIPISLISTFTLMALFGFSFNTLTLLAMVLTIGLVVDDAIVVLENIQRHIESGKSPAEAAEIGGSEIQLPIIAMTLTLAAVFTPVALSTGVTGRLFREFALTLAGAVIISGFVALTLTPLLCSKILNRTTHPAGWFDRLEKSYHKAVSLSFTKLPRTLVVIGIIFIAIFGLFKLLPAELAPTEDRSTLLAIAIAPDGATIGYTDRALTKIENIIATVPEVTHYFTVAGFPVPSQGLTFIRLQPWEERSRPQKYIMYELMPKFWTAVPDLLAFPTQPPPLGASPLSRPFNVVIKTIGSYESLHNQVNQIMGKLYSNTKLVGLDTDLKLNKPEISLHLSRDLLSTQGISVETVGRTLESLYASRKVGTFKREGKQYDVLVQRPDDQRQSANSLSHIFLKNDQQQLVPLTTFITEEERTAPAALNHFNRFRAAHITAGLVPGYALEDALKFFQDAAKDVVDPSSIDYDGDSRSFIEGAQQGYQALGFALVFIFLVLAAQFESFLYPCIMLLTVPFALFGALLALFMTFGTLNIYSEIGLITLIGLITKHGILLVDFANKERALGKSPQEAALLAAELRLRPILMTTCAMILGALPLILSHGAGAESRAQIGWVIVGGMSVGTYFTLFIIPLIYTQVILLEQRYRAWRSATES